MPFPNIAICKCRQVGKLIRQIWRQPKACKMFNRKTKVFCRKMKTIRGKLKLQYFINNFSLKAVGSIARVHFTNLQVALFLVDTQGLFDIEASERDVTIMGTLNFLLSSLQCFNVMRRIDKVQLDYIFVSPIFSIPTSCK